MEWKSKAEYMRFEQGLSWAQIAEQLNDYFPGLNQQQIFEKVRTYIRSTKQYRAEPVNLNVNDKKTFNYSFDNDSLNLYIISDAHCGASSFMEKEFKEYIAKIEQDKNAIVVITGDLIENATIGSKSCVYSQVLIPQKQKEKIIKMLYPIRDKIISVNIGNHEQRTFKQTGNDIMYDICLGLDILNKYSPSHSYINIKMGKARYKIYTTHNIGKSECALIKMAKSFSDVDILIGGHIHTPKHLTVAQKKDNGKQRDITVIISNAWLYDEGYSISAAYEPVSVKPVMARVYRDSKLVEVIV